MSYVDQPKPLTETNPELAGDIVWFIQYNQWRKSAGLRQLEWRIGKGIRLSSRGVDSARVGRNDECICGSELKYKKCCGRWG